MSNSWYFPGEDALKKTGALNKPSVDVRNDMSRMRMTENISDNPSQGIIFGKKGMSDIIDDRNEKLEKLLKKGYSQQWDFKTNQKYFAINEDLTNVVPDSIIVYKNGGEALIEGKDYEIVSYGKTSTLMLNRPARSIDDDLELRCQIYIKDQSIVDGVLILPRKMGDTEFDDVTLESLMPSPKDVFAVGKLLKYGNLHLTEHNTKKAVVLSTEIQPEGLVSTIQII